MRLPQNAAVLLLISLGLATMSACSGSEWATSYDDVIDPDTSRDWQISGVDVRVPRTLTVSEANIFAPSSDIVWREDPLGNRYEQVDAIITDAATRGSSGLLGTRDVQLVITMTTFHALTQKTRFTLQDSGVHNIAFFAQVFDANTGEQLSANDLIRADLIGYSGNDAERALAAGQTQKVRITDHVAKVIAGWLQIGPDVRGTFIRNGR